MKDTIFSQIFFLQLRAQDYREAKWLRSDLEKWAWNNEDTLAVALHFVFCPHARHSTTKVTTSRCCGKITRRESICWQLAPREELSLLSCQIHSHQLRGYCQHSLLRNCCAKLAAYTQSHSPSILLYPYCLCIRSSTSHVTRQSKYRGIYARFTKYFLQGFF